MPKYMLFLCLTTLPAIMSSSLSFATESQHDESREYTNVLEGTTSANFTQFLGETRPEGRAKDSLSVSAAYTHYCWGLLGPSALVDWTHSSTGTRDYRLLAGVDADLTHPVMSALYVKLLLGIQNTLEAARPGEENNSDTDLALTAAIGKRFELIDHFAYSPEVRFNRDFGKYSQMQYVPIAFSFIF